jgi:hypothetical protein
MNGVFDIRPTICNAKESCAIRIIVCDETLWRSALGLIGEMIGSKRLVRCDERTWIGLVNARTGGGFLFDITPGPSVAEPQGR